MIQIKKLKEMTFYHLIVAATELETRQLASENQAGFNPDSPVIKITENIDCLITGIGQYNTIKAITQHICLYGKPTSMINIGIAGAFHKVLQLTSLVNVVEDIAYDQKVATNESIQNWQEADLPNARSNIFKPQKTFYIDSLKLANATGLTSDTISSNQSRIETIMKKYNPTIETMEGAAFFYVAKEFDIPSVQIRAISNYVGETNKSLWKIKESIEELNKFVKEEVLTKLISK